MRYDRVTGTQTQLTEGYGGGARPAISHGGDQLAYISRRDADTVLVLRDLETGAERILARGLERDEMEGFAQGDLYPGYAFLPDDSALVLSDRGRLVRIEVESGRRQEIPFEAEVEQWAAPLVAWQDGVEEGPVEVKVLRRPALAPDGRTLVFEALGRIWRQAVENGKAVGEPQRLTPAASDGARPSREYAPALSPDGSAVAYVSWSDGELGAVWRVPLAGGEPRKLTSKPGHFANPTWSPGRQPDRRLQGFRPGAAGTAAGGRPSVRPLHLERHRAGRGSPLRHRRAPRRGADLPPLRHLPSRRRPPPLHPGRTGEGTGWRGQDRPGLRAPRRQRSPDSSAAAGGLGGLSLSGQPMGRLHLPGQRLPHRPGHPLRTAEPPEVSLDKGILPVFRLSEPAGAFIAWAEGGASVTWALGNTVHRLPVARALDFAAAQKRKAAAEKKAGGGGEDSPKADLELPPTDEIRIALTAPRAQPTGSFVLRGARVVTMKGDEILPRRRHPGDR